VNSLLAFTKFRTFWTCLLPLSETLFFFDVTHSVKPHLIRSGIKYNFLGEDLSVFLTQNRSVLFFLCSYNNIFFFFFCHSAYTTTEEFYCAFTRLISLWFIKSENVNLIPPIQYHINFSHFFNFLKFLLDNIVSPQNWNLLKLF
jgi:hypothetical protein